jgi:hypothetical protein
MCRSIDDDDCDCYEDYDEDGEYVGGWQPSVQATPDEYWPTDELGHPLVPGPLGDDDWSAEPTTGAAGVIWRALAARGYK